VRALRQTSTLPIAAVSENVIFARGHAAAVYRVHTKSFEFLSIAEKERLHARLAWWFLKAEADLSIWRVCREYPTDAYVADAVNLIDERFADRGRWERLLESHAERMRSMRSFTPEVYFVVSLNPARKLPISRPRRDSGLIKDAEQAAFEALTDQLPASRATSLEIQWALRRVGVRGVCEPDVDPNWYPPALALDGGVWESTRADVQRFMSAVRERSRTLHVECEDGESHQAMLAMGPLPRVTEYPGNAELLFAPLETLDFPVDAVCHVKWIPNKTMQTKADTAVKDARNAIEDAAARLLDHQTARRIDEARNVQDYFASEPYPPGLDACISLAVGAEDESQLRDRVKRLRRAYGSVSLYQPHALQVDLYADHLLRPDGATVRDYRQLITREQLAAMMPIGSHQAGSERGIYTAYTIPGSARPVAYNPLEASATNRAGAVMFCGTLGSGKTIAVQKIAYDCAMRGSLVVDIDPRPDHSFERLPGLERLVHSISLADVDRNRGRLDPLVVAPPELREELGSSYMMEILPAPVPAEWQTEIIAAVRDELRGDRPSSGGVVKRLVNSEDSNAVDAGKALKVWANWGLGKLAFSLGVEDDDELERELEPDLPVTTIKASALSLPPAGTARSNYDQSERVSVATLKLIVAYAMRKLSTGARNVHKVLVLDEAHVLTSTADGRRFLERLIRMGRSMNITVMLSSQLLGDMTELEELIGVRFSFRQETDEQAKANIRMHGLDDSNERLITMLRGFTEGRCLMRGLDGRVAAVRFDPGAEFLRLADTNPTTLDLERMIS
jgi:hypothetical protein